MLALLALALMGYPWPLAPMNEQHPITGTFAEYRTGPPPHFHAAVDIYDLEGTPVYAVASGEVLWLGSGGNGGIRVGRFAYVHVVPRADLHLGDWVEAGDLVGWLNDYNHVHFKDGGGASGLPTRNPLLPPERLDPFQDPYRPGIFQVQFFRDGLGQALDPQHLTGRVDVVVLAMDTTDLNPWGTNNGIYRIGYALYRSDSLVRGPDTVFTFVTLPSNSYVHLVYAPWSNNGEHYYIVTNHLETNGYFDFQSLGMGDYTLHLFALDTEGNSAFQSVSLHAEPPDTLPPGAPEPTSAWITPEGFGALAWHPVADSCLSGYTVYLQFLNGPWTAWATLTPEDTVFTTTDPLPVGWVFGVRLRAQDCAGNPSDSSRVFTWRRQPGAPRVLLVDGRWAPTGGAVLQRLAEALQTPQVTSTAPGQPWADPPDLWWFLSDTGSVRWSPAETLRLQSLIAAGGRAVITGTGWPTTLDSTVLAQTFGTLPGDSLADTLLTLQGVADPFQGLSFTARVRWPLSPQGPGQVVLQTSTGAAVGIRTGSTLALAFAWSTVEPESLRRELTARIAAWGQVPATETPPHSSPEPQLRALGNGRVQVLASRYPVTLELWDVAGRRITRFQVFSSRPVSLPSLPGGVYLLRMPGRPTALKLWHLPTP